MDEIQKHQKSGWDQTDSRVFIIYGRYFEPDRELVTDIICQFIPRKVNKYFSIYTANLKKVALLSFLT